MKNISDNPACADLYRRVIEHVNVIYPNTDTDKLVSDLVSAMKLDTNCQQPVPFTNLWDEKDVVVITYGDSLKRVGERPLVTLGNFLDNELKGIVSAVHILPFFPYSSDEGFSVIDYLAVNGSLGTWQDISDIASRYRLMSDLVINHCSSKSRWFENYQRGEAPGKSYFLEADPQDDLTQVVRPRTTPLLRKTETNKGARYLWCTFSHDQVDLDFENTEVLLVFVRIIRFYIEKGVNIFRFDAIAFLWKEPGTRCINLPQTHELIRLLRTLIEYCDPTVMIITETNIPNHENLTYFGNANEAHSIYNFSLPPLLLNAMVTGNCKHLKTWMMTMPPARNGTTYLNFIASHDGIGLRPAEGLLTEVETKELISTMEQFGGRTSWRTLADGREQAYEINISLFDAMQGTVSGGTDQWQMERFLCAHAIMLALEGIPAFYIHSLFGTKNDNSLLSDTGQNRAINRHKWDADELNKCLGDSSSHHAQVFNGIKNLIRIRSRQPAFHPNATQFTLQFGEHVFAFWRQSIDRDQSIFALYNVTDVKQIIALSDLNLIDMDEWADLIKGKPITDLREKIELSPYQVLWISNMPCTEIDKASF